MRILAPRCGTCGHPHLAVGCPECDCPGLTQHPDDAARVQARVFNDLVALGGRTRLDAQLAEGLLRVLAEIEADRYTADLAGPPTPPKERVPQLAAIGVGNRIADDGALIQSMAADYVGINADAWNDGIHPDDATSIAAQWVATQPEYPTIAWVLICYGEVDDNDGNRRPVHVGCAADIDGRTYQIVRFTDAEEMRLAKIAAAPGWAQLFRGDMEFSHPDAVSVALADGLNRGHYTCCQLMAATIPYLDPPALPEPQKEPE